MKLKLLPVSFFALTLGLAETGNAWRFAHDLWALPPLIGEIFQALAILSFIVFLIMYVRKWRDQPDLAREEAMDPVQSSFIALIPESIILISLALNPYHHDISVSIFWIGSTLNLLYATLRLAGNWTQQRSGAQIVPPLYLPYTASILVNALVAGEFGYTDYGWALFGIGAISWLVIDSSITHQLMTGGLSEKTRNFMGIYSAPPVVAFVAYQVLAGDNSNLAITYALAGYSLFVFAGLTFASKWLRKQDFAPGYWAYTFGVATLGQGLMLVAMRSPSIGMQVLAGVVFAVTLILVLYVAYCSVGLLLKNKYFPLHSNVLNKSVVGNATI